MTDLDHAALGLGSALWLFGDEPVKFCFVNAAIYAVWAALRLLTRDL